jgi:flagellar hook-associated protein 2
MAISTPGIGSNLDVNGIVDRLMALEQRPLQALNRKEASFQARISAFGTLKGALASFQKTMQELSDPSKFQAFKATSSDTNVATTTAANTAVAGNYSLEVSKLAQSQKLVAAGQESMTSAIGTGTLTFEFGTISGGAFDSQTGRYTGASFAADGAGAKTVTIGPSNNTLGGIRDAINSAKIGVTASIVNDGGATPYRLALSVNDPGAAKSLRISSDSGALGSLLAQNPAGVQNLTETISASNAEFKVDGVAISKPRNTVSDVIEGVTLNLRKTNVGNSTSITVARDGGAIRSSADALVKGYNDLNNTLKNLSAYNPVTRQGTVLQGDATLISVQARVRATLSEALQGVAGSYNTLWQIGISFNKDGTLALDSAKFDAALEQAPNDFAALFGPSGRTSDAAVAYVGATDATQSGTYGVTVSRLASQGTWSVQAGTSNTVSIAADINDRWTVTVDGASASVTLTPGNYSRDDLALHLQSTINGASAIAATGSKVAVSASPGGEINVISARYGSSSSVQLANANSEPGAAPADLIKGVSVSAAGQDVAGTINGIEATGSGRVLSDVSAGASGGLKVEVTGGSLGDRGNVVFSRGYAARLDKIMSTFLASDGAINAQTAGIEASIKRIDTQRGEFERRLQDTETRIRAQFIALDTLMGKMSSTSTFLTQQLSLLNRQSN